MEKDEVDISNDEKSDNLVNSIPVTCPASCDFKGTDKNQLTFKRGQVITILEKSDEDWWWAELDDCFGYVPANHLNLLKKSSWEDEEYFGSYGNLKLHHEMLSDRVRTEAYMTAIQNNAEHLKNKVVLEIGCGTGILSMMVAKYGQPQKVYALEASEMAQHAQKLVEQNNLDQTVEVIHGYAESCQLDEPIDLIISEWMGTVLLFEMMIESVIVMRDRLLKENGTMWPSSANLLMVPCVAKQQYQTNIQFWDKQYGFDFSPLKEVAKDDLQAKPLHNYILPESDCLSKEQSVINLDMKTVTIEEVEETQSKFKFSIIRDDTLHAFCMWFEVEFSPLSSDAKSLMLNTGPRHELTHWKQDLFMLDEPISVCEGNIVEGTVTFTRNPEWRRHLHVLLQFVVYTSTDRTDQKACVEKKFFVWR